MQGQLSDTDLPVHCVFSRWALLFFLLLSPYLHAGKTFSVENNLVLNSKDLAAAVQIGDDRVQASKVEPPLPAASLRTVVIPIEGEIAPATVTYLKRAIAQAEQEGYQQAIFEINTFGGRLDSTYEIVEIITAMKIPSVSLVKEKAISAGTLIALSSPKLYLLPGATIGDVAPVSMGADGVTMLGEKFQSPLRAKFRALAEKNGYPVKLSEAFVSIDREIIEVTWQDGSVEIFTGIEFSDLTPQQLAKLAKKKTLVAKGELLTMNDREAQQFGFSSGTVETLADIPTVKDGKELTRYELLPSENLLFLYGKYSWLLVLIGLGAIYLEVKNPGFGFYGLIAIASFTLLFLAQYLMELANYGELVLLILGFALLFVEVFLIPGFGLFGLGGIVCVLISLILMFQDFVLPSTPFEQELFGDNLKMVLSLFLVTTIAFVVSLFVFPKALSKSPLVLAAVNYGTKKDAAVGENSTNDKNSANAKLKHMLGHTGVVVSKLRPSGHVEIAGETYDAIANDGAFIDEGETVKVCDIQDSSLRVERGNLPQKTGENA